jgi:hypothetical protein
MFKQARQVFEREELDELGSRMETRKHELMAEARS